MSSTRDLALFVFGNSILSCVLWSTMITQQAKYGGSYVVTVITGFSAAIVTLISWIGWLIIFVDLVKGG